MNKIMISIKPEWVAKILNGEKTIEIRKTAPKDLPCEVYIYCTKHNHFKNCLWRGGKWNDEYHCDDFSGCSFAPKWLNGKVVAKFRLNKINTIDIPYPAYFHEVKNRKEIENKSCLSLIQLHCYLKDQRGYAYNIEDLELLDKPLELKDFGLTHAPQSWCYIKGDK